MMWLIAAIVFALPSVTSDCEEKYTLDASNPTVNFETPHYPRAHNAEEECTWKASAPGNVEELKITCDIDIIYSDKCLNASFIFYNYDEKITLCGTDEISETLKGSTSIFKFKSSMSENSEYKGVSCTVSYSPEDIPTCTTPVDPSCQCGEKGTQRIVDGIETSPNDYPWHAKLMYKSSKLLFCGGSLIAKQWVLSASHCVEDENHSSILVVLGEGDYESCDSVAQDFEVTEIIRHEHLNQKVRWNNDIALLKLVKPAAFISPICLPFNYKYYDFTDQDGTFTGWGLTIPDDDTSEAIVLKKIEQKIIMYSKCTSLDGYRRSPKYITENMICALAEKGGACMGDSGGPMVWSSESSGLYFQLGVGSFMMLEANFTEPTVYTRVSKLVDWIVEKTEVGDEFCIKI